MIFNVVSETLKNDMEIPYHFLYSFLLKPSLSSTQNISYSYWGIIAWVGVSIFEGCNLILLVTQGPMQLFRTLGENRRERKKAVNSGHCNLPAMPKPIRNSSLGLNYFELV
jgi:hypothetical protein